VALAFISGKVQSHELYIVQRISGHDLGGPQGGRRQNWPGRKAGRSPGEGRVSGVGLKASRVRSIKTEAASDTQTLCNQKRSHYSQKGSRE